MGIKRKFFRELMKRNMVMHLLAGAAVLMAPWQADAAVIPQADGAATVEKVNENVSNIYPGKVMSVGEKTYGMGVYKEFNVEQNKIANMYFHTQGGKLEADSLLNLVNSKIEINGTVNAIRNSQIGGHLYFFSKDGIMVGSTGVINAGALTLATPNRKFFRGLNETEFNVNNMGNFLENHITDINNLADPSKVNPIILNNEASIIINGRINTYQGVTMRAPFIYLNKAESNSDGSVSANLHASINNNVTNFSDFVNIKKADNTVINALTEADTEIQIDHGSGNVLLAAYANGINYKSNDESFAVIEDVAKEVTGTDVEIGHDSVGAVVDIGQNAVILNPGGGAVIQAVSVDKPTDTDTGLFGFDRDDVDLLTMAGIAIRETSANVNVDGNVTAAKVNMTANTTLSLSSANFLNTGNLTRMATNVGFNKVTNALSTKAPVLAEGIAGVGDALNALRLGVAWEHADAKIAIGENAKIKSISDQSYKASASSINVNKLDVQNTNTSDTGTVSDYINTVVNWTDTDARAKVDINGKLEADGDVSAAANTSVKLISGSTIKPAAGNGAENATTNLSVDITTSKSDAQVTLAENADINAKGDVSLWSNAAQSYDTNASISTKSGDAAIETVANIVVTDAVSKVNVNGDILGKNINLDAKNAITFNEHYADNSYGKDPSLYDIGYVVVKGRIQKFAGAAKNTLSNLFLKSAKPKDTKDTKFYEVDDDNNLQAIDTTVSATEATAAKAKWGDYFDFGMALAYVDQKNLAEVNIGSQSVAGDSASKTIIAALKADESLKINAESVIKDSYVRASSNLAEAAGGSNGTQALVSSAIVYNNSDNKANVNIAGTRSVEASEGQPAHIESTLLQAPAVNINSKAYYEYDRLRSTVQNFKVVYDQYKSDWESIKEIAGDVEALGKSLENLLNFTDGQPYTLQDLVEFRDALGDVLLQLDKIVVYYNQYNATKGKTLVLLLTDMKHSLDAGYYLQSYAAASTTIPKTNTIQPDAVTATINLNFLDNNSKVNVGDGVVINSANKDGAAAADGKIDIWSHAKQVDTLISGRTKSISQFYGVVDNTAGDSGLGGTLTLAQSNVKGAVNIGQNAKLTAQDIKAKGENTLLNIGITYGGAKTSTLGITGMLAYAGGTTESLVNVAQNAELRAANDLVLQTKNDTVVFNAVGDFSKGENTSVGISSGVLVFKENSKIAVDKAELTAGSLEAKAETTGVLTNMTVAGVGSSSGTSTAEANTNTISKGAAVANTLTGDAVKKAEQKSTAADSDEDNSTRALVETAAAKNDLDKNSAAQNGLANNPTTNNSGNHSFTALDGINVNAAGSASVTAVTGATSVDLNNSNIDAVAAKVVANDLSVVTTLSGSAALSHNNEEASGKFAGNLAGALAVNNIDKSINSKIRNSNLVISDSLTNEAKDNTIQIALGTAVGMDLSGRPSTPGVDAGISGSFNFIASDVKAELEADKLNEEIASDTKVNVNNVAVDNAVQAAGGISAEYAKSSAAVGASVTVNQIDHAAAANIKGGTYKNVGTLVNYALSDATQVGVALSGGIVTGSGTNYATSNAAVAVNIINNSINSIVDNTQITAEKIDAKAFTGNLESKEINETVAVVIKEPKNSYLTAPYDQDISFIDWRGDGLAASAGVKDVSADTSKLDEAGSDGAGQVVTGEAGAKAIVHTTSTENVYTRQELQPHKTGAIQVTGAAALDMNLSNGAGLGLTGGAVVAVGVVKNNIAAEVKNNIITANEAKAESWTQEDLVTAAGQVNFTKGNGAGGITYAQNDVGNNVSSKVLGNTLNMNGGDLSVKAEDRSNAWTVSVGGGVAANAASAEVQGSVAVNTGTKSIAAIVDIDKLSDNSSVINGAGNITVQTFDNTSQKAIAGGFAGTNGYGAIGAAIATNNIGSSSNKQTNEARLSNTVITMTGSEKAITVKAEDCSGLYGFAVGAAVNAGSTGAAVDGNAATGVIYKTVEAKGDNLELNAAGKNGKLNVEAENNSLIITSADAAGFAMANAGVAGAVAVTESFIDTKASINGLKAAEDKEAELKSALIKAQNKTEIYNVGIDAALTVGTGASVVGNFITNRMDNHTEASVNNAKLKADGTVGVIAASEELIRNYAGTFAGTDGTGYFAAGASVAVNLLNGDTKASVSDSDITALGNDTGLKVNTYAEKEKAETEKSEELRKGLVVDADGSRSIYNVLGSIGESIGATTGITAFGSVAVNHIGGETSAVITKTDINNNYIGTVPGNVYVDAKDNSKLNSHIALVAVGGGGEAGVAIGGTSNTDLLERKVKAEITSDSKNKLYADKLLVHALNHADEFSTLTGLNIGAAIYGSAAVGLNVAVTQHQGEALAHLINMEGKAKSTEVEAERINRAEQYANSAQISGSVGSGSVGVGVAYVDDISNVEATVKGAKLDHYSNNDGDDKIIASNSSQLINEMAKGELALSIGGGAGILVNVNNIESKVSANVINSELGKTAHAQNALVNAKNKFAAEFTQIAADAALGSVGVGVEITTVDSTVTANVLDSHIYAQNLDIKAEEERSVDATAVAASVGGLAVNTNVMVVNMGSTVKNQYTVSYTKPDGDHATTETLTMALDQDGGINKVIQAALTKQNEANNSLEGRSDLSIKAANGDHLETALDDYKRGGYTDTVNIGADKSAPIAVVSRGISTNVNNSTVSGSVSTNLGTSTYNKADLDIGSGLVGVVGVAVDVGVVDVTDKSNLNISDGSVVSGKDISISSVTGGDLDVLTVQAGVAGLNINAAVTDIDRQGGNSIVVNNSQIAAGNSLVMQNTDTTKIKADVQAYALAGGNLGALVGNANDNANNLINLSGTSLTAGKDISVYSDRRNAVASKAINVSGNFVGDNAVWLQAGNGSYTGDDSADYTKLNIDQSKGFAAITGTGNRIEADSVSVAAYNRSIATAENTGVEGSLLASASYTAVNTTNAGGAKAVLGADSVKSDNIQVNAYTTGESKADVLGVNTGVAGAITINEAYARSVLEAEAGLSAAAVNGRKNVYADVSVNADNRDRVNSTAVGYQVGILTASGTNKAMTKDQAFAKASFTAPTTEGAEVTLNRLNITAQTNDAAKAYANGDGGGITEVSPEAAYTDNKGYFTADTNLKGNINIIDSIAANAINTINTDFDAEAIQAGIVQGSGTEGYSHIRTDANVTLDSAKLNNLGSNNVDFLAKNILNQDNSVLGNGYGGLSAEVAKLGNYVNANTSVNMTNNSSVVSAGNINMAAAASGTAKVDGFAYALGAVADDANIDVANQLTTNNQVNIGSGSKLQTTALYKNINLSASENNLDIQSQAMSEAEFSALGVTTTSLREQLNRNNTINVAGELYSMNNIGLYAGKDVQGNLGVINSDSVSEVYNKSLIPVAIAPSLDKTINHDNEIIVANTGSVKGVHNVELYGDAGQTTVYNRTGSYTNYYSDADSSSAIITSTGGKLDMAGNNNDKITIDGEVIAGVGNSLSITIGNAGDLIFTNENELAAVRAANNSGSAIYSKEEALQNGRITVVGEGNPFNAADLSFGQIDYGNVLLERYQELDRLLANYSEDKSKDAYKGYLEEYYRIHDMMVQMHLMDTNGNYLSPTMKVDYVALPENIVAAGGDITLNTANVNGAGTIKAQGTPTVNITNNTNLLLAVNNITVMDEGGSIYYNGQTLGGDVASLKNQIKDINLDKTAVAFTNVTAAAGYNGTINISGNYAGSAINYIVNEKNDGSDEMRTIDGSFIPKADINIQGLVNSNNGTINVTSEHNNISVYAVKPDQAAGLSGSSINIVAADGSVSQGSIDGIVNVGGNPKDIYSQNYNSLINEINTTYTETDLKENIANALFTEDTSAVHGTGATIAGESIYINATDININGVLQSGYAKYEANIELTDAVQTKINNLDADAAKNKNTASYKIPSDAEILGNQSYKVCVGQDVYDESTKSYKRQVDVYYNPYTKRFLVPDVDAHGGQIYLTGRISSTGDGRIICLDGAYDIAVNNNVNNIDLQLGKLISNEVSGKITIEDKAKGINTVITRDNQDASVYNHATGEHYYLPKAGLRYNWTSGQNTTTKIKYEKETMSRLWGEGKERTEDYSEQISTTIKGWEQNPDTKEEIDEATQIKLPGATVANNTEAIGSADTSNFVVIYNNTILDNTTSEPVEESWSTGLFGCHKHYRYTWYEETGSAQSYLGSVKADNYIPINFIGKDSANAVTVEANSQGSIYLNGTVGFGNHTGTNGNVKLNAQNGSIIQETNSTLKGDTVLLTAKNDIKSVANGADSALNITAGNELTLGAANASDGKVLLNVDREAYKAGTVALRDIGSSNASVVELTTAGAIEHSGTVMGQALDITSKYGGANIAVAAGDYVNVKAAEDINLVSTGDLRLGTVNSTGGNVSVESTSGKIIDALPNVELDNREKLKARLEAAGMIASADTNAELVAKKEAALAKAKEQGIGDSASYTSWNLDRILYAVDESKINPRAGVVDSGKAANVTGKNISLTAAGTIGQDVTDSTTTYSLTELKNNMDALKAVALANPYSVTWGQDSVTLSDKALVGVQTRSADGLVDASTINGNIYLEGRSDINHEIHNTDLKLGTIDAGSGDSHKDIIVTSLGSITSTNTIEANNLDLRANGNIGGSVDLNDLASTQYLDIDIKGTLTATAIGDIAINKAQGALTIGNVSAKGDIYLKAGSDLKMAAENEATLAQNYIRSEANGNIILESVNGDLGAAGNGLRIANSSQSSAVVDSGEGSVLQYKNTVSLLAENGNVYVKGVSSSNEPGVADSDKSAEGTLYVYDVKAKDDLSIMVNGDLDLLGNTTIATEKSIHLETAVDFTLNQNLTSKDITIKSDNNVTVDGAVLTASNDINVAAKQGNLNVAAGSFTAENDVNMAVQTGNVNVTGGSLTASHNVNVTANTGDINVEAGSFNASNDVNVTADTGNVNVGAGSFNASNDVNVTANTGNVNVEAGSFTADDKVSLKSNAGDVNITSLQLNAAVTELSALEGKVLQSTAETGGIITQAGQSLTAEAKNGISLDNAKNDFSNVSLKNTGAGDILLSNGGTKDLTVEILDNVAGNVKLHNVDNSQSNEMFIKPGLKADGLVDIANYEGGISLAANEELNNITGGAISIYASENLINGIDLIATEGTVELKSDTTVNNAGNIQAAGDASLIGANGITNAGNIEANGNVSLTSANGVTNAGNIVADKGTVALTANAGDVSNTGSITSGSSTVLNAVAGSVTNENIIISKSNGVTMQAAQDVNNEKAVIALGTNADVALISQNGDVNNSGVVGSKMDAEQNDVSGKLTLSAVNGSINNDKALLAGSDINLISNEAITNTKGIISNHGSINIKAEAGIESNAVLKAGENIALETSSGAITSTGLLQAGNKLTVSSWDGAINIDNGATAGQEGMAIISGNMKLEDGIDPADINIKGDLVVNNTNTSAGDIVIFNSNGDITMENAAINNGQDTLLRVYAAHGDITANNLQAISNNPLAEGHSGGSVDVGSKNGSITVNSINADWMAGAGTGSEGGDIYIGSIRGNAVVLYAENAAAKITAGSIYTGEYLAVQGNNFELPEKIDGDYKGLAMHVRGTAEKPIVDNYELEVKDGSSYSFGDFWVDKATIKVTDGSVRFSNIMVTDHMSVDYKGFVTSIYGAEPKNDGSPAIYYAPYNSQAAQEGIHSALDLSKLFFEYDDKMLVIKKLREEVTKMRPGQGTANGNVNAGMYLFYDSQNVQHSNGFLLHLDDGFYVYGQRQSAENLHRKLLDTKASLIFNDYYQPKLIGYNRFNLILDETKAITPYTRDEAEAEDYLTLISDGERLEIK